MLVLARHKDQTVYLRDAMTERVIATITLTSIKGDTVRMAFDAPQWVAIHRDEVDDQIYQHKAWAQLEPRSVPCPACGVTVGLKSGLGQRPAVLEQSPETESNPSDAVGPETRGSAEGGGTGRDGDPPAGPLQGRIKGR